MENVFFVIKLQILIKLDFAENVIKIWHGYLIVFLLLYGLL